MLKHKKRSLEICGFIRSSKKEAFLESLIFIVPKRKVVADDFKTTSIQ